MSVKGTEQTIRGKMPDTTAQKTPGFVGTDPKSRVSPSRSQFDYIILSDLTKAIVGHADAVEGRALDYGCGIKPYVSLFPRVSEYVGADFPNNPHADIQIEADGLLPAGAQGVDAVVSFQVLEHVTDVGLYLSECRRALAQKKGKLLLTTHGIWEYHPEPRDLYRWTHEGLAHTIEASGFKTLAVEPVSAGMRSLLQIAATRIERRNRNARIKRFLFPMLNRLADWAGEDQDVERRLRDFPIGYLYLGTL